MDISNIKEHLPVYAEGPGGLEGASDTLIGIVDKVEGGKYIKLTKQNSPDREHHWLPVDWVRAVDERAVFLNKTVDEAAAQWLDQEPSGI